MKYRMNGEDYGSLKELLDGPLCKMYPTANGCFIEGHALFVRIAGEPTSKLPSIFHGVRFIKLGHLQIDDMGLLLESPDA